MYYPDGIKEVLYSEKQISEQVAQLGKRLTKEYAGKNPLFICVLKGASVFFSDLIRQVSCPLEIGFIFSSSYGKDMESNKCPDVEGLEKLRPGGRDIVIVEDIIDTGYTLSEIKKQLAKYHPNSVKLAVLLNKYSRREVDIEAEYVCFKIEDEFVVGYGLDYSEKYRNLPYIGICGI